MTAPSLDIGAGGMAGRWQGARVGTTRYVNGNAATVWPSKVSPVGRKPSRR